MVIKFNNSNSFKKITIFSLLVLLNIPLLAEQKKSGSLREANKIICDRLGGEFEIKYNFLSGGKVKVDCITNDYAIEVTREVGYANALYYALRGSYLTKKKAKIILYSKIGEKSNQFKRLKEVIDFYKLPISVEVIQPPIEFKKRKFKKRKFKQETQTYEKKTYEKQTSSFKKFKRNEKTANKIYCEKIGGVQERKYIFHNSKNASKYARFLKSDCETEDYAIEMGYDDSSYRDAVFQALTYAYLSQKKAKIVLYKRHKNDKNFRRVQTIIKHHDLPIDLEHLDNPLK